MSESTTIDISRLPAPAVVEPLDYEVILAEMLADLQARDAQFSALLESDPAYKILEVAAYRELLMRQRVNEAAKACMLATAQGADLDNLALWWGVERLQIKPADNTKTPPIPAVMESDEALRRRTQMALEGFTTAGSTNAYIFHGLSADPTVKDISVESPEYHIDAGLIVFDDTAHLSNPKPNHVAITVLSTAFDGLASAALVNTVSQALNNQFIRPLTDLLVVRPATIIAYSINADLFFYEGVAQAEVVALAVEKLHTFVTERQKLGGVVALSGIYDALHETGVRTVRVHEPIADIVTGIHEAPFNTQITLNTLDFSRRANNESGNTHNGALLHNGAQVYN